MWYSKVTPAVIAGRVSALNMGLISKSLTRISYPMSVEYREEPPKMIPIPTRIITKYSLGNF
ncbi:hypothetical protein LEPN103857_01055 [Legionella pneumophila subsp. pneumophila]|nr:Uncharacterised protein [Legionella pneumophila]